MWWVLYIVRVEWQNPGSPLNEPVWTFNNMVIEPIKK